MGYDIMIIIKVNKNNNMHFCYNINCQILENELRKLPRFDLINNRNSTKTDPPIGQREQRNQTMGNLLGLL